MSTGGVRLGEDGRLEVVRLAPPEDADAVRRAAARLRAAAGAGAVDVLSFTDDGTTVELVLAFAGRPPAAPLDGATVARLTASVAGHLADLALRGIAHGAVRAEHVLVDASGAVRLCGFTDDGVPAEDVRALGELALALLDERDTSEAATTVRTVAARCTTDDATARPTMAAVAASLAAARGATRRVTTTPRPPDATGTRRIPQVAVGVGALVIAVVAIVAMRASGATSDAEPGVTSSSSSSTTTSSIVVSRATRLWPPARTTDPDGVTWTFDRRGEVHLLDHDCDGVQTPLLVENDRLWIVESWPETGEVDARYVTTLDGLRDAVVERGPSCDRIVVTTADGRTVRPELRA